MGWGAPEIIYLFQENFKDTPLVALVLIFELKIAPSPPPHETTHNAPNRKNLDEKDAPDNDDSESVNKNVLSLLVLSQFKKQIRVILL